MNEEEANLETLECARYGEPDELRDLLSNGADPNFKDDSGNTAMHKASANGEIACLEVLKEFGSQHLPNKQGNFPIHWAAQNEKLEAVNFLINNYDVDVLAQNSFGRSTLTEAFQTKNTEIIEACLSHPSSSEDKLMETNPASFKVKEEASETADDNVASSDNIDGVFHNFLFREGCPNCPQAVVSIRELPITRADNPFGSETAPEDDTTGLGLWPASVLGARWAISHWDLLEDKVVMELGAGCGLPSFAVAANCRPSKVYLTDIHTPTLDNAKYNTSLNNTGLVEVLQVNWCQENTYPAEPIDVLIGSDLVYDKQILTLLVPTVHALLKNGGSFLYVAPHEARDGMADFKQQLCDYKMPNATVEYVMACVEEVECPAEYFSNPLVTDNVKARINSAEQPIEASVSAPAVEEEDTSDKFVLHFYDLSLQKSHIMYHFRKMAK